MNPQRRRWLQRLAGRTAAWWGVAAAAPGAARAVATPPGPAPTLAPAHAAATGAATLPGTDPVRRGRPLVFPRDHGAHPHARIEWWYATGWLRSAATTAQTDAGAHLRSAGSAGQPTPTAPLDTHGLMGFQLTFFRSRTGLAADNPSRFAARQLLFAHAAVTTLGPGPARHLHAQRIARWNGQPGAPAAAAAHDDGRVHLGDWWLRREGDAAHSTWSAELPSADFGLSLQLARAQPVLLQGDAGFSRKGPEERQASHYYSEPQLRAQGHLRVGDAELSGQGRAWLDQEWSDELLHPEAVGWDWIGMNLFDGSALTAFQLRRRDGSALWAGGSLRRPGEAVQVYGAPQLRFRPERAWTSAATNARYPVQWQLEHPAGPHTVRALLDNQEMDGRSGTGTVYWEGLSELLDGQGRRVGLGYLEMTGYSGRLRL